MDQVSILLETAHIGLINVVLLDARKFGLEIERISHLIEEEGEEEVAPIVVKLSETFDFDARAILIKLVAVGHCRGNGAPNHASDVQIRLKIVAVRPIFHAKSVLCYIIFEVDSVVCRVDKRLHALLGKVVVLVNFGAQKEGRHVGVIVRLRESILRLVIAFVGGFLTDARRSGGSFRLNSSLLKLVGEWGTFAIGGRSD